MINQSKKIIVESIISFITTISVILIIIQYTYDLNQDVLTVMYVFDLMVSIILSIDFYKRARKSGNVYRYLVRHFYEIPSFIPIYFFVLLTSEIYIGAGTRSLRLLSIFRFLQILSRTFIIIEGLNNRIIYTIIFAAATVTAGALSIYAIESNVAGSKIVTLGDAFWWAIETVTTVGYGDMYPVTSGGRVVALFLMIIGIAILGILISTLGASLIESRMKTERKKHENDIKEIIKQKIDRIEELEKEEISALLNLISVLHLNFQSNLREKSKESITSLKEVTNLKEQKEEEIEKVSLPSPISRFVKCTRCKNINPNQATFCFKCGFNLFTNP